MAKSPVFIVGSPRSGTSILVDAMESIGYQGYREGNFLTLMTVLNNIIDRHFKVFAPESQKILVSQVDPNGLKDRIADIFGDITNSLNTAPLWFDKTGNPEMILAIPTLRRIWPDSVFIFAKRRGIENVASRQKKFPGLNFEYHCVDWAKNMSTWRAMRETIPLSRFTEIDQQDLLQHPEQSASKIIGLLGLSGERKPALLQTFSKNRPQETEAGSAVRIHTLESVKWNDVQKDTFRDKCTREMDAYGYSFDETYWLEKP